MYNGIGLSTPRGSGTNGYVQRNLAFVHENTTGNKKLSYNDAIIRKPPEEKQPNLEILEHERKRQIEAEVYQWAEDEGLLDREDLSPDDLEAILAQKRDEIRKKKESEQTPLNKQKFQNLQESHARNLQKRKEIENFKDALKLGDYVEGSAFDRKLQEKKRQEALEKRVQEEVERREKEIEKIERERERERERLKREKQREKERREREKEKRSRDERSTSRERNSDSNRRDRHSRKRSRSPSVERSERRSRSRESRSHRDHKRDRSSSGERYSSRRRHRSSSRDRYHRRSESRNRSKSPSPRRRHDSLTPERNRRSISPSPSPEK